MIDVSTFYRQVDQIQEEVVQAIGSHKAISPIVDKRLIQLIDTKCVCKDFLEQVYFNETCQKAKCLSLIINGIKNPVSDKAIQTFQETYARYKSQPETTSLKEVEKTFSNAMGLLFKDLKSAWPLQEAEIDSADPVQSWICAASLAYQRCQSDKK
jgi:hypothetical protein